MSYRIKTTRYKSGRKVYYAQFKRWYGWVDLDESGAEILWCPMECRNWEAAGQRIDNHFTGNHIIDKTTYEPINIKP